MKRIGKLAVLLLALTMILGLSGCNIRKPEDSKEYKLNIVTTLFPYYDMVRAIAGEVEGIHISMTVAPGQDSHSFEPTPKDVIDIGEADVFIYNGGSLETWIDTLLDSLSNDDQVRLRMMDYVDVLDEEHVEGMDTRFEEHDHYEDMDHVHEEGGPSESSENAHFDEDEADEHIWTSPVNTQILTQKICDVLCEVSPENAGIFKVNAKNYIAQLQELDDELHQIVERAENKEIIFADKFPLLYFAKEYGLKYYAAFPGCGSDMEPSARTIAFLIDKIKEDKVKAVFYLELSSHIVADAISEETKTMILQFNSCHNITQKQFDDGVTYVDLMKENVDRLRKALN